MNFFISKKNILLVVVFIALEFPVCYAQIYKYIGIEEGLSNQKIYSIQKGYQGYMWFLTQEGLDRYNGKEIKHYAITDGKVKMAPRIDLNWLYFDKKETLWVIGRKGRIFQYDINQDLFKLVYRLPELETNSPFTAISFGYVDNNNHIWLCTKDTITLYDIPTQQISRILSPIRSNITSIEQIDNTHFFIGTENGLSLLEYQNNTLQIIPCPATDKIRMPVNELYFHPTSKKLFIGTFKEGILVYNMKDSTYMNFKNTLNDVSINRITPLNDSELLIATKGKGIYKLNIESHNFEPYIVAGYRSYNQMNGNNINDIYVDDKERIWLANYPAGITIRDNRYKSYDWIKHSIGNSQSLINDQVYDVIEDSEGDLWFGTSNGISLYISRTGKWHSILSLFDSQLKDKNHIFMTLCEVSPGIIWAGGYTSGIYQINKRDFVLQYLSPDSTAGIQPDQYITDIKKDSEGYIWSGGFNNLRRFDLGNGTMRLYPGLSSITSILEKSTKQMWIGTSMGLYLLEKEAGSYQYIQFPIENVDINVLYQTNDDTLYIGTRGDGMLVYDIKNQYFVQQYQTENCALVSDNIYTIVPRPDGDILLGTENGLVNFSRKKQSFHNWTKDRGLMSTCFNAGAATLYNGDSFIFGTTDGAIKFPVNMRIPEPYFSQIIFSDFSISYQPVHPGDKDSPLKKNINETDILNLAYEQNTFSLKVSSINYDYPSNILYTWRLEGFHNKWSYPSLDGHIRITKLDPGRYTLRVRTISNEEKYKIFEEKSIQINIAQPAWASTWALIGYTLLVILAIVIISRVIRLRKQKQISDEKTQFFINTAHDIRTPLTLIKAPLEDTIERQLIREGGVDNIKMALRSVNALLRLTTNLINFEKIDVYSSKLYVSEYELNTYMSQICNVFYSYAGMKHVNFTYESNFDYLTVWFDKDKMDSILKNVLSNAFKYTADDGNVDIRAYADKDTWSIEIKDTGIGIPLEEQKKLFKNYFRGSNVINLKVTGSGIGLMLVYKLVRLHKGKISISSTEKQGTYVRITFPQGNGHFHKAQFIQTVEKEVREDIPMEVENKTPALKETKQDNPLQRILIVEDNDDLRTYLTGMLAEYYSVQSCSNGKDALVIIREFIPELVLSDIMMPEMRGDELCTIIKSDIETSHIPVILLTALSDEKNMLGGLEVGADAYITKPFSIAILKGNIKNVLTNRVLLRNTYASPDFNKQVIPANCANSLDWKFIAAVKKYIEENVSNTDLSVDMLCRQHTMSRTGFFNKLKALTGYAPSDYIRLIRLQRAAQLLEHSEYQVTEIADMVGFSDAKYFREVFKKYYKVSPSEYRNSSR